MTKPDGLLLEAPPFPNVDALKAGQGRLRLRTLVWLRWIAIAGQTSAIGFVHFVLGFELPLALCIAVIAVSFVLNLGIHLFLPVTNLLSEREASSYLAFDILQLAALLFLTGGVQNPFTLLFLAPVTISAATLNVRSTVILGALAGVLITLLAGYHYPLPWRADEEFTLRGTYLVGLWIALLLGIGFTAAYAWRVAVEGRRLSEALAATQFVLAREQRLTALGGLAAAAAHELGTPLATIQLAAKELEKDVPKDSPYAEDIALINSQTARCRNILRELLVRRDADDAVYARQLLGGLVDEVVERYGDKAVEVDTDSAGTGPTPQIWRRPEIIHGLGCFVQNAVDFARHRVMVVAAYDRQTITITIRDDGPGFAADVLSRLGEPYVSKRPGVGRRRDASRSGEGHGLGFFIAKTLLEHTGGLVTFGNELSTGADGEQEAGLTRGAIVSVTWPRRVIEATPASSVGDKKAAE